MRIKTFVKQCREHDLFKMLSIYVVSSWVILQVLSVTSQPLGLPQKAVTFLIITLLICLPIYLFIIWKYKIVPLEKERLQLETEDDGDVDRHLIKRSFKKYYVIASIFITTLCAFAIFFIIDINFIKSASPISYTESPRIAVLKFGNNTGDPKYDDVGKMASDWIMHGITENKLGQVISQDVILQYNTMINGGKEPDLQNNIVKEYLQPAKIVSGNYFLKNGKLVFQATLTDGKTDKTLFSLKPEECLSTNPLNCIEQVEASITGFLATEGNKKLMLQEDPPNYEAYKLVLEAKYGAYDDRYLQLIEKAIEIDPNYFEAKVLRVAYNYNKGKYAIADSLLNMVKPESNRNERQINLINMYDALLSGNNKKVYKTNLTEFNYATYDLESNSTTMVIALQYVNRVKEVDSIYNLVKSDTLNIQTCSDCADRIYIKARADIELKKYAQTIKFLEKALNINNANLLKKPYLSALLRNGDDNKVNIFMDNANLTETQDFYSDLCLYIGKEYLLINKAEMAKKYLDKVTESATLNNTNKASSHLYNGNFKNAESDFEVIVKNNPTNTEAQIALAISKYKSGKIAEATKIVDALKNMKKPYQFGVIDYALAQYYAVTGDTLNMYDRLLKSVGAGHLYEPTSYKNDLFFKNFKNTKKFNQVMNFWQ